MVSKPESQKGEATFGNIPWSQVQGKQRRCSSQNISCHMQGDPQDKQFVDTRWESAQAFFRRRYKILHPNINAVKYVTFRAHLWQFGSSCGTLARKKNKHPEGLCLSTLHSSLSLQ